MPVLYSVVIYVMTVEHYMSYGPTWKSTTIYRREICANNFWRMFLMIKNQGGFVGVKIYLKKKIYSFNFYSYNTVSS